MSRPDAARSKRPSRFLRVTAAFVVLLAIAGYVVAQYITSRPGPARCVVKAPGGSEDDGASGAAGSGGADSGGKHADYVIRPEQAANAATITAVAAEHGLPNRAVEIALATALQESGLRNITHGDRDSLGLFQQRPSQGWGTQREITDPVYSTGEFYNHLAQIPDYRRLPLTEAAQRVQHSGYPEAYAKHERHAAMLTSVLTGRRAAAFDCTTGPGGPGRSAGSPQLVRERLVREFGQGVLPAQTQRVSAPSTANGTGKRNSPSELRIPVRLERSGWQIAHWAVANSAGLHITQVSYENRVWNASTSPDGWHTDSTAEKGAADGGSTTVTLRLAAGK